MKKAVLGIIFCLLVSFCCAKENAMPSLKYYTKLIQQEPDNPQYYLERGKLYYEKRKPKEAILDFSIAQELDKDLFEAYYYKSAVLLIENEIGLAFEELSNLIKQNPKCKEAYSLRSFIYFYIHDYDNEIKDLTSAIKIDSEDIYLYRIRAHSYFSNQQYDKAIKDLTHYISKTQNTRDLAFAYSFRSDCYFALKQKEKAIADWKTAIKLDRKYERDVVKFMRLQTL